jgi:hypothetical protein
MRVRAEIGDKGIFRSNISPRSSTSKSLLRSPMATALVTSEIENTRAAKFDAIFFKVYHISSSTTHHYRKRSWTYTVALTFLVKSAHVPCTPSTVAIPNVLVVPLTCSRLLPSRPIPIGLLPRLPSASQPRFPAIQSPPGVLGPSALHVFPGSGRSQGAINAP